MLADLVDAVVGVDTHRDTHQVEIALPNGAPIAVTTIGNDTTGYAELLAWIVDHAPGPRLAVSIEGTRSYGVGLARAAAAAGLIVLECEQPSRKVRCGKGKSDPIDAHLAVLAALRLDADRLPSPRADGDREALRILLSARQELTTASTAQTNRLQLQTIVNDVVPGLIERRGIGPVSAAQAIVSFSHPGRCRNDAAFAALGGVSPLPASSGRTVRHRLNRGGDRALNRALHTIAATRMRSCPTTQAYVARRTAEGKNPKEIRRCLKRYIARQLYRTLTTSMTPAAEIS